MNAIEAFTYLCGYLSEMLEMPEGDIYQIHQNDDDSFTVVAKVEGKIQAIDLDETVGREVARICEEAGWSVHDE